MSDILVVEDSRTQAEQLLHLLSRAGYETRVARDGAGPELSYGLALNSNLRAGPEGAGPAQAVGRLPRR